MSKAATNKTAMFLEAMEKSAMPEPVQTRAAPAPSPPPAAEAEPEPAPTVVREMPRARAPKAKPVTRAGLKHFGGYLDDDTLEKVALLRVRLKKDNSELITQAIEDLYRKHNAKRAFGDA
jgi:hypothetical protein